LRKIVVRKEGVALSDYLRKKRVEVMKHLLETTDLKCYAICRQVGIKREDTGVKLFKRMTGMTMDHFRRLHGNSRKVRRG
jgi:YesN/AraC family two-component response regulator